MITYVMTWVTGKRSDICRSKRVIVWKIQREDLGGSDV